MRMICMRYFYLIKALERSIEMGESQRDKLSFFPRSPDSISISSYLSIPFQPWEINQDAERYGKGIEKQEDMGKESRGKKWENNQKT